LIDLGAEWLEEEKDVEKIKDYFKLMGAFSKQIPYFLHSNKVDYTDDLIGKNLISNNLQNLIMTKHA